jgi:hypothetical protein
VGSDDPGLAHRFARIFSALDVALSQFRPSGDFADEVVLFSRHSQVRALAVERLLAPEEQMQDDERQWQVKTRQKREFEQRRSQSVVKQVEDLGKKLGE